MSKQPWKGHNKDSWQKHTDDSHLFTSIRHHTMPFVVPKPVPCEKELSPEVKLEKEIENQFISGNYRFSEVLKAISIVIKPLFLISVLPFYLGFYVIPTWLCSQGKHFYSQFRSKISQKSNSFKSKIASYFNPIIVFRAKIINFKSILILQVRSYRDSIKIKFQELIAPVKTLKLKIDKTANDISARFYAMINKIKSRWLEIIGTVKKRKKTLQDRLIEAIKAPFIFLRDKAQKLANEVRTRFIEPVKKRYLACVKFVADTLQNITDRKNRIVSKIKGHINLLKARIVGIRNLSLGQSFTKVKSIKSSALGFIGNLRKSSSNYVKSTNFTSVSRYAQLIKNRWDSLTKGPKERYRFIQERIKKYKSDIRHFAIHLPGNIKKKIPEVLSRVEKRNDQMSNYVKQGGSLLNNKLKTLKKFVPAPVKHTFQQVINFYTRVKAVISEKRQQMVLMILILQVWIKVICKYSKYLVTSHRFTKLMKFKQKSMGSELDF